MASKERSFYLDHKNKLGWDYDINCNTGVSQLTDGRIQNTSVSFLPLSHDVFKWKIENISDCINNIFVSTKDFVQLFMDRRQFVFDFMDFLIKNQGTNNMILAVNSDSGKVDYSHNYRSKVLSAFEEKYDYLFEIEKIKGIGFNNEQGRVPCSTIIFSNSGKLEIKNMLLEDIYYSYFTKKYCSEVCLRQEIESLRSRNQKTLGSTISRCSEISEGSTKTESDLFGELSTHLLFALRNEFGTESAYNNERISKLKLLADESDESATSVQKQDVSESTTITMNNKDYRSLQSEMAELLKMDIVLSNKALQPFVKTQDANERILLGFGSHRNRTKPKTTEASDMFVSPCPLECTIDDRQWICINCGEFFKTQGFQVICSCGTTHVTNLKLECFDPKHPKDFFPCEKHDPTSASITSSCRSSFSVIEDAQ
uniref:Uncharacterized protein n=1 Tax=Panagrolaimus sp. JU765 TaxID=591449 RepID=A0AC34QDH4_9BILA